MKVGLLLEILDCCCGHERARKELLSLLAILENLGYEYAA